MVILWAGLILLGLGLSACDSAALKDNFTEADQVVETPWSDYVLPATGIVFDDGEDSLTLVKGETHTYSYSIQPRGATANSINWFSDDINIATVENGVVTAVGGGKTTITASVEDNAFDPVELNVNVVVPLTDFTLNIPEKLEWNEEYQFDVTYEPVDTTERNLKYEISESSVAGLVSINEQGVVTTTNQNGTAKLKVTGGEIVKEFTLTVESVAVSSVTIADAGHEVEVNHSLQLNASVTPANARDLAKKGIKYYSNNPDIASIDEITGVVLGLKPGNATVYAECGEVKSADYAIEVYKVNVTAVDFVTADFTLSNASDIDLSKQLEYTLTLNRPGHTEPSDATISFVSSNEGVATVSDTGLVTAV